MWIRIISSCSIASLLLFTAWIDITESLFNNVVSVPKPRYIKRIIRIPLRRYMINTSRKTNIVSANIANIDATLGPQNNIQFNPSVGRSLPQIRKVSFLSNNILQRLREAQRNGNTKTGQNQVPTLTHTVVLAKNANILSHIGQQQNGPAISPAPAPTKGGNQPGGQGNNPGQGAPNKPQGSPVSSLNFVKDIKVNSGNTFQMNTDTGNTKINSKIHRTNVNNNINNIHITNNYSTNAPPQGGALPMGHRRQPNTHGHPPQGQLPVGQGNLPHQPTGHGTRQGGHNPGHLPSGPQHQPGLQRGNNPSQGTKPTPGTQIHLNIVNNLPVKNNASNKNHRMQFSPSSVAMKPNFATGFHGANNGHSSNASQNPGPVTVGAGSNTGAQPRMRQPGGNPANPGQGGALPSGRNRPGQGGPLGMGNQLGGGHGQQPGGGHGQQPGGGHGQQPGGGHGQQPGGGHGQQPGGGHGQQPGGGQWQQPGGGHGQQPGGGHGQQPGGGHGQQPGGGHGQQPGGGHGQQPGGGHGQQPGGGHGQQPI
ncbi:uncharacterized protein LOC127699969 isoform X12 [Mytilus californianus]|uniref:uncharacterized protein LOC127699969 isoform X12 n=1 Tax=Mytilus californianus TaxID=6549 RepID=UPI0022454E4B|nr:uncharacterized protein LOC127699969 isoform X12 [Mytilus californianus]